MEQPPDCKECGKPLKEYAYGVSHTDGRYGWAGCGYFCTKDCAAYWAVSKARRDARECKHEYGLGSRLENENDERETSFWKCNHCGDEKPWGTPQLWGTPGIL